MFETILSVENIKKELRVPFLEEDADGLNFLAGKRLSELNSMAEMGTMKKPPKKPSKPRKARAC